MTAGSNPVRTTKNNLYENNSKLREGDFDAIYLIDIEVSGCWKDSILF
jgi:hypothetical protein